MRKGCNVYMSKPLRMFIFAGDMVYPKRTISNKNVRWSSSCTTQGLYSLSGKTSYRQISWNLEATRLDRNTLQFDRHLGNGAAHVPVELQNDQKV